MMISQAYLYLATGTVGWNPTEFFNTKPGADPVNDPFNFALILRPFQRLKSGALYPNSMTDLYSRITPAPVDLSYIQV